MYLCIDDGIPVLGLEEDDRNVKILFLCKHIYILSFIDDFYLRLEAIFQLFFIVLKLHAHHECDTLSNGNIVRKRTKSLQP